MATDGSMCTTDADDSNVDDDGNVISQQDTRGRRGREIRKKVNDLSGLYNTYKYIYILDGILC